MKKPALSLRAPRERNAACSPFAAGFRPAAAALAVAAALGTQPAGAQPSGAQAIHGSATLHQQGQTLVVTTRNGAGTGHSAINWQTFSVPAGSATRIDQPSATSTSINRVLGPNPSEIFGTLSSNGRLVLVNPAGIAVGTGAVVDTAGFTASTLRMGEADAVAGRLRFGGDGAAAGPLSVAGRVLARSGDVVLIAPDVRTTADALIRSPEGATVLAAGQTIELTGRGLEGIHLQVQAPGDQAVNLGRLEGDAVGIFAGTLRHSGVVQATAVSADGGRVVLKVAGGDSLVDGRITANALGGTGGAIDVLGTRVGLLAGAALDASGAAGGGQVRIGGDYQGANAAVPNAQHTSVDAAATVKADATVQGDGGRVIVWADGATRMNGQLSARGGEQGGNGGFVEASGKQFLEFRGRVDTRAPKGTTGTLLLDPNDVVIGTTLLTDPTIPLPVTALDPVFGGTTTLSQILEADLEAALARTSVVVVTNRGTGGNGSITINGGVNLQWATNNVLGLQADNGIVLNGSITAGAGAAVSLQALGGGVTQDAATSVVTVGSLLINARNGGVDMLGANQVDTLAAQTAGAGNNFSFNNTKGLRIGAVATPYGAALSGINADDGVNVGAVSLTVTGGDLTVAAGIRGASVALQGEAITAINGAGVAARGDKASVVLKTTKAGVIDLSRGYIDVGGNLDLSNAGDVVLGTVVANSLTAKLSGSLVQHTLSSQYLAIGGIRADVGGSINLAGNTESAPPNRLGYLTGSAGGDILANGVAGVGSGGLFAGGNISLTADSGERPAFGLAGAFLQLAAPVAVGDLDLLGNVTAGGTATFSAQNAGNSIVVQDTSTVSATRIEFLAPITTVHGTLKPGGAGGIGSLSAAGDLVVGATGSVELDVKSPTSFDQVAVAGTSVFDAGALVKLNDLTGGTVTGSFAPARTAFGTMAFAIPTGWTVSPGPDPYIVSLPALPPAPPAPAPAPTPVPAPVPVPTGTQTIDEPQSLVVTFQQLWQQELDRQEEAARTLGKDDIVVTDSQCKPS